MVTRNEVETEQPGRPSVSPRGKVAGGIQPCHGTCSTAAADKLQRSRVGGVMRRKPS